MTHQEIADAIDAAARQTADEHNAVRRRHSAHIDALRLECAKAGHIFQMRTGLHIGPPRTCAVCGTAEPKEG